MALGDFSAIQKQSLSFSAVAIPLAGRWVFFSLIRVIVRTLSKWLVSHTPTPPEKRDISVNALTLWPLFKRLRTLFLQPSLLMIPAETVKPF